MFKINKGILEISINKSSIEKFGNFFESNLFLITFLSIISALSFVIYYLNGLGVAYNDARSHLDIGRRVVEGLKPGLAQLGSVWLPLPHILISLTVWNDFMWHSGLSGSLISMIGFVATAVLISKYLENLGVGIFGRLVGVLVFVFNINILYLQSTAMTESLLLATMTAAAFELLLWHKSEKLLNLIKAAFWIMLSTLVRYDGWFLFLFASLLIGLHIFRKSKKINFKNILNNYQKVEGHLVLFATLAGFGIFLWFLWNLLIFKDPLYFAYGPYSAHTQQKMLEEANNLATKGNLPLSIKIYLYALLYNSGAFIGLLGLLTTFVLWFDKKIKPSIRIATFILIVPLIFNIVALYLGHSVLFIQGISGNTWFNVRYGVMMLPSIAIFLGYLVYKLSSLRWTILGLLIFVTFFSFTSQDAVTIDDATVGASQKNVSEVSSYLSKYAKDKEGFVLISAASHDAIIFSSGLPMKKFIHEGTGRYWEEATTRPSHWARWIVMRTYDNNDSTYKAVSKTPELVKYNLVEKYPFADVYQLKEEYLGNLETKPVF